MEHEEIGSGFDVSNVGIHHDKPETMSLCDLNTGKVYTPRFLADWVASVLLENIKVINKTSVLDPACGEGELLLSIKNKSKKKLHLCGVDIDPNAVNNAAMKFETEGVFIASDAIIPDKNKPVISSWTEMLRNRKFDGVIANPPWGAHIFHSRKELIEAGYTLSKGQFDTWELFIELSLKIVKRCGVLAFIIPGAIFLPEHQPLRKLLQERTTILMIARLGEGLFQKIYRGTTVILVKNECPKKNHIIETFRLNKDWRVKILSSSKTLDAARQTLRHYVPQQRFWDDEYFRWDIDTPESEWATMEVISSSIGEWTKWLVSGRGVELSKNGMIIRCPNCGLAMPSPRRPRQITCKNCAYCNHSSDAILEEIIEKHPSPKKGWAPLIVGEDVDRYQARAFRRIKLGVPSINYKNKEYFRKRRILIRKTGVGIKASIVDCGSLTNQVVFHYSDNEKRNPPAFYLSYVLGVLCSRVMFAYHLRKGGENEWRSHPYLTQKVIARLPIPVPKEGKPSWQQAQAIADTVDQILPRDEAPHSLDLKVECLVFGLFGLTHDDVNWVHTVINSAQALEPMRSLKELDLQKIRPLII